MDDFANLLGGVLFSLFLGCIFPPLGAIWLVITIVTWIGGQGNNGDE